jgi:hypothetical protein
MLQPEVETGDRLDGVAEILEFKAEQHQVHD